MTTPHNLAAIRYVRTVIDYIDAEYFCYLTTKMDEAYRRYFTELLETVTQASAAVPQVRAALETLTKEYGLQLRALRDNAALPRTAGDQTIERDYVKVMTSLNKTIYRRIECYIDEAGIERIARKNSRWLFRQATEHAHLDRLIEKDHDETVSWLRNLLIVIALSPEDSYSESDAIAQVRSLGIYVSI